MRKMKFYLVSLVACMVLAVTGFADHRPGHPPPPGGGGGGGKGGGGTGVRAATFRDCTGPLAYVGYEDPTDPGALDPDCPSADDRIKSEGNPSWVNPRPYVDGEEEVGLKLGRHAFELALGDRQLFLDFTDCAQAPCTPPFNQGLTVPGIAWLIAHHASGGGDMRKITVGESNPTNLRIAFRVEGDSANRWFVRFAPNDEECGDSTTALVTRTDETTWVFEASDTNQACLLRQEKPGSPETFHGIYKMPTQLVLVWE